MTQNMVSAGSIPPMVETKKIQMDLVFKLIEKIKFCRHRDLHIMDNLLYNPESLGKGVGSRLLIES